MSLNLELLIRVAADQAKRELADLTQATQGVATETRDLGTAGSTTASVMDRLAAGARDAQTGLSGLTSAFSAQETAMQRSIGTWAGLSRATDETTASVLRHGLILDETRARYNPLFAASRQYELQLRDIAEAERMGAISAMEAAAARDRAAQSMAPVTQAFNQQARGMGAANAANATLIAQWNDIAMMTAAGQNPLMLALQQGTQVTQAFDGIRNSGTGILRALGQSFVGLISPINIATIAIIGFGAAGVQWLMKMGGETKTLDEQVQELEATLGRIRDRLDLLDDDRLSERFGNLTQSVRTLTDGLLKLDRVAELKQLQSTLDDFLTKEIDPTISQRFWQTFNASGNMGAPVTTERDMMAENYADLKTSNSFDDFERRQSEIMDAAKRGDIEVVTQRLVSLQQAMSGGGAVTDMSDEAVKLLTDLGKVALALAEVEAAWNGTANKERVDRETNALVSSYQQQAELSRAMILHGEKSAEVEAIRARHAREAFEIKMREAGITAGTREEAEAIAAFTEAQAADQAAAAAERREGTRAILADLVNQSSVSEAILRYGENSAQVETIRAAQARETLRARLEELNTAPFLIDVAMWLLDAERARAKAIKDAESARQATDMLAELQNEAAIRRAILQHGRDSVQVKELQIAAERRAYTQQVEALAVSREKKDLLLQEWEISRGLAGVDPYGNLAAAQELLKSQADRVRDLRLELSLATETETVRNRILALERAEKEIRDRGLDVNGDAARQLRAGAIEEAALESRLARVSQAWGSVQDSAESAIESMVEALRGGDISGALDALSTEIASMFAELAITNPLKNAILGTDLGTMADVGGLSGIWGRLTGRGELGSNLTASSMSQTVGSMQVNAATVILGGGGVAGLLGGSGMDSIANLDRVANQPVVPTGQGAMQTGWSNPAGMSKRIMLSEQEIIDLKKTVATEWVQSAGDAQAQGIIDTILNRRASGKWGATITDVVNAPSQFSDVNGRPAWQKGRSSVDQIPLSRIDPRTDAIVNDWLRARAAGAKSSIGDNLNYANPYYSDAVNQGWIAGLQGPVLGAGRAIHRHGTTPDLQAYRPGEFGVTVPAQAVLPTAQLQQFGAMATTATQNLGTLGNGFDVFGNALAQGLNGLASGGSQGGLQGLLGSLAGSIAKGLGIPGFARGGWTGTGATTDVAGVVHAEEYVFDAAATRRIGVANLEALRRGSLRGYRQGGYVRAGAPPMLPAAPANGGQVIQLQPVLVNNTGRPMDMQVEETTDARGQRQQRYVLSDVVGDGLATPGGKAARSLQNVYGVRRSARSRN